MDRVGWKTRAYTVDSDRYAIRNRWENIRNLFQCIYTYLKKERQLETEGFLSRIDPPTTPDWRILEAWLFYFCSQNSKEDIVLMNLFLLPFSFQGGGTFSPLHLRWILLFLLLMREEEQLTNNNLETSYKDDGQHLLPIVRLDLYKHGWWIKVYEEASIRLCPPAVHTSRAPKGTANKCI